MARMAPQSFGFLRRSLARNAHDAAELYAHEQYPAGAFPPPGADGKLLCVPLAAPESAAGLISASASSRRRNIENLPVPQRLKLEVATRQFDTALHHLRSAVSLSRQSRRRTSG